MTDEATTPAIQPTPPSTSKKGGCLKGCLIALVIFLVLGAIGGYLGFKYVSKKVTQLAPALTQSVSSTTLTIDKGTVTGPSQLSNGDKVTTGPASAATITFPNGSETRLDENTSLTITTTGDKVSLFQNLGRSWSRVAKLAGTSETFEVETPTAVATVRGTSFATTISGDDSSIDTDEGQVEVAPVDVVSGKRTRLQSISVDAGNSTSIKKSDLADLRTNRKHLIKEAIKTETKDSAWFKENHSRSLRPKSPAGLLGIDPTDLEKLKGLSLKAQSLTPDQIAQIEVIAKNFEGVTDPSQINPADLAKILAIIDPTNFSDTAHWTSMIKTYLPLLKTMGKLNTGINKPDTNNSSLFNSLQNLPAIGIPNKINP